jgi:outer membrane protein assembly factor BamB
VLLPGSPLGGVTCITQASQAWAVRLTASGHTLWRSPIRGWANHATSHEEAPITPVSPLVIGGVAVVADGDVATGLRLSDGRMLWRWTGPTWVGGLWQWHGLIIVLTGNETAAQLAGLEAETGAVAWTRPIPSGVDGQPAETSDGGLAVAEGGGGLEVVNLADGTVRWRRSPGEAGPLATAGGTVVAVTGDGQLTGYDDRTGTIRWTFANYADISSLTALNDQTVATGLSPSATGMSIVDVFDAGTGRLRWQFGTRQAVPDPQYAFLLPDPVIHGGPAVLAVNDWSGQLWVLSLTDGHLRRSVSASLVPDRAPLLDSQDVVTFQAPDPNGVTPGAPSVVGLVLVSTDTSTGMVRWVRHIPPNATEPIVQSGTEIVVSAYQSGADSQVGNVLLAYRAATGQPAWRVALPAVIAGTPAPVAGGLVVQAGYDTEACAMPN